MSPLSPQEHRRNAIQAGASTLRMWFPDEDPNALHAAATEAYDALAPGMRRAWAEEAAQAIEAATSNPVDVIVTRHAARIVRKLGGIA